jgi:GntR family transcriptional regulator of abcA and norABC
MKDNLLSTNHSKRLFEQVYDYIVNRIERGEWKEHEKLPSVRLLAQEMDVHRLTVFKAYQLLKRNGKVYVKDKAGYYVHPGSAMSINYAKDLITSSYLQKTIYLKFIRYPLPINFLKH